MSESWSFLIAAIKLYNTQLYSTVKDCKGCTTGRAPLWVCVLYYCNVQYGEFMLGSPWKLDAAPQEAALNKAEIKSESELK